jgi:hypothetical protein
MLQSACGLQRLTVVAACRLAAAVGGVNKRRSWPPRTEGRAPRAEHLATVELIRHGPADDAAGMKVDEDRRTEPALPRPNISDFAHPCLVRAAGVTDSGENVWRNLQLMTRVRCGLKATPCVGDKAAAPHGTVHARTATAQAALVQLALHAPAAVAHLAFELSGSNLGIAACGSGDAVAVAALSPAATLRPPVTQNATHRLIGAVARLRHDETVAPHYCYSQSKRTIAFLRFHALP